jgi:hypothetical protein
VVKLTAQEIKEAIKQALMAEPSPSRYRLSQLKECLRQQWLEVNEPETDEKGEPDGMELGHFLRGEFLGIGSPLCSLRLSVSLRFPCTALRGTLTSFSRQTRFWKPKRRHPFPFLRPIL